MSTASQYTSLPSFHLCSRLGSCHFHEAIILRSVPVAARLLRLWVRIPTGAWTFVCCECCVLAGRGLCDELITRPEESYGLGCVVVCDLEKPCLEAETSPLSSVEFRHMSSYISAALYARDNLNFWGGAHHHHHPLTHEFSRSHTTTHHIR